MVTYDFFGSRRQDEVRTKARLAGGQFYNDRVFTAGWEFPQMVVNSKGSVPKMALNQVGGGPSNKRNGLKSD